MAKLSNRELERELEKAGEIPCDAELEHDPTPHEIAVENIRGDIEMEYMDFGDEIICLTHKSLHGGRVCSQCKSMMDNELTMLLTIDRHYKLDPALFNYGNFECLCKMDDWLIMNGIAWNEEDRETFWDIPDEKLHPNFKTKEYKAVQEFKKLLKSKGLTLKLEGDRICTNSAYELNQILDAWLEYSNNHEVEMMRNANAA